MGGRWVRNIIVTFRGEYARKLRENGPALVAKLTGFLVKVVEIGLVTLKPIPGIILQEDISNIFFDLFMKIIHTYHFISQTF